MNSYAIGAFLVGSLALAGCNSTAEKSFDAPKPLDKMSNEEWCGFYARYLANPKLPDQTRKLDIQRMHERGCPDTPAA